MTCREGLARKPAIKMTISLAHHSEIISKLGSANLKYAGQPENAFMDHSNSVSCTTLEVCRKARRRASSRYRLADTAMAAPKYPMPIL